MVTWGIKTLICLQFVIECRGLIIAVGRRGRHLSTFDNTSRMCLCFFNLSWSDGFSQTNKQLLSGEYFMAGFSAQLFTSWIIQLRVAIANHLSLVWTGLAESFTPDPLQDTTLYWVGDQHRGTQTEQFFSVQIWTCPELLPREASRRPKPPLSDSSRCGGVAALFRAFSGWQSFTPYLKGSAQPPYGGSSVRFLVFRNLVFQPVNW